MIDVIPANLDPLETWLVDSSGHIAVSKAGLGLLERELSPGSSEPSGTVEVLRALREG
jgi:hypothetical protein